MIKRKDLLQNNAKIEFNFINSIKILKEFTVDPSYSVPSSMCLILLRYGRMCLISRYEWETSRICNKLQVRDLGYPKSISYKNKGSMHSNLSRHHRVVL